MSASQAIGMLPRNRLYAGVVNVPEYGVCARRGDFEPLMPEDLFHRVQAVICSGLRTRWPLDDVRNCRRYREVDLGPHYFAGRFNVDGFMRIVSKAR